MWNNVNIDNIQESPIFCTFLGFFVFVITGSYITTNNMDDQIKHNKNS